MTVNASDTISSISSISSIKSTSAIDAIRRAIAAVHPTKMGVKSIGFYMLLVCAFYAAPYLNLFFLLLTFLSVLGTLTVYWSLMNVVAIKGEIHVQQPFPAGASAVLHATLHCGRLPRRHLRLDLRVGIEPHTAGRIPYAVGAVDVEGTFPPLRRGIHEITHAAVSSEHPFGMLRVSASLTAPAQLVVYPTPADLSHFRDRHELLSAMGQQGGHCAGEMGPAGLREYKPGDELRHIHWKASARRRELVVKEYEGGSQPGLELLLDLRCAQEELEASLSLITALALVSEENKDVITLTTQEHRGTNGKGHRAINELWTYLAEAQPLPPDAPPPMTLSPAVVRLPAVLDANVNVSVDVET
ncbi:MAG: DUF58 domain-containing protein [Planctomycetota bacterium]